MLKLIGFEQISNNSFLFLFDREIAEGFAILKNEVPETINIESSEFNSGNKIELKLSGKQVRVVIPDLLELKKTEYSLILLINVEQSKFKRIMKRMGLLSQSFHNETYYFELVRQPAEWLKHVFDHTRSMGYSILGRRTIDDGTKNKSINQSDIFFNSLPNISSITSLEDKRVPAQMKGIEEFRIVRKIVQLLWAGDMQDSPTDKSYSDFMLLNFEEKLLQIHKGEFPVSCQGIRDMFLHAALGFPKLQARAVNAHNYKPQFENLISYAHATAEVYIEDLKKWVLTDPWTGFAIMNESGEYLSAQDLSIYNGKLEIIPLIDQIVQSHIGSSGMISKIPRRPIETKINTYTFTEGGHVPDFKIYFNELDYGYAKCIVI